MTTTQEQKNAVYYTWYFLMSLLDPQKTPNVPRKIREEARGLVKHYPYPSEIRDGEGKLLRNLGAEE